MKLRNAARIKGFAHARAAQLATALRPFQSRQGTASTSRSRRQPISLPGGSERPDDDEVHHDEASIENPVFAIHKLRLPDHMLGGQ